MGEHADDAINALIEYGFWDSHHSHGRHTPGKRNPDYNPGHITVNPGVRGQRARGFNSKWEDKGGKGTVTNREVAKKFKSMPGENGEHSIVLERGAFREVIAVSFNRKLFRSRGFVKQTDTLYARHGEGEQEVINMTEMFQNIANLLNNLHSAELLVEETYNAAIDGYEPFIHEALEFEEFEGLLEESALSNTKKKRISRRDKKVTKATKK